MNIIRAEIKKKKGGGREAVSFSNRTMVLTTDKMKPEPQEEHKKLILHLWIYAYVVLLLTAYKVNFIF